ncbi:cation diffusion facilitator family transporter [Eubacteriales bacterium KG127]
MITEFIIKTTINDNENTQNSDVRSSYGKTAAIVGIMTNITLAIGKLIIGLISSSISIAADGINNLSDATSSVIALIGFKLSQRPSDKEHPYGHARSEYIAGMVVSVLIVVVGVELMRSSIEKIITPANLSDSPTVYLVLVLSILIKLWQSRFYNKIAARIGSVTLEVTATDSKNDVITTSAVLIGLTIFHFAEINVDGYVGCFVALYIMKSGISLIKETASPLLGEAPDSKLVEFITNKVLQFPGVLGVHDLVVHNYGHGQIFASIHVEVDSQEDVMSSHELIDDIEKYFVETDKINVTCHLDPIEINNPKLDLVCEIISDEISHWKGLSNPHDIRIVPGKHHSNVIFEVVEDYDTDVDISAATEALKNRLKEIDSTYEPIIHFEPDYSGLR